MVDWGAVAGVGAVLVSLGSVVINWSKTHSDRALGVGGQQLAIEELNNTSHEKLNKTLIEELAKVKMEVKDLSEKNEELDDIIRQLKARDFVWQQRERQLMSYIHAHWGHESFPVLLDLPPLT